MSAIYQVIQTAKRKNESNVKDEWADRLPDDTWEIWERKSNHRAIVAGFKEEEAAKHLARLLNSVIFRR